jgi:hypothetical protein
VRSGSAALGTSGMAVGAVAVASSEVGVTPRTGGEARTGEWVGELAGSVTSRASSRWRLDASDSLQSALLRTHVQLQPVRLHAVRAQTCTPAAHAVCTRHCH